MTTSDLYRIIEEGLRIAEAGSAEEMNEWRRQRFSPLWIRLYPPGSTLDAFGYDCDRIANNISYTTIFPQRREDFLNEARRIFDGLRPYS